MGTGCSLSVSKTVMGFGSSWVRIPLSPPDEMNGDESGNTKGAFAKGPLLFIAVQRTQVIKKAAPTATPKAPPLVSGMSRMLRPWTLLCTHVAIWPRITATAPIATASTAAAS